MSRIHVVGAGYVGLVSGACYAHRGNHVTIYDSDRKKLDEIESAQAPFYEPELEPILSESIRSKRLKVVRDVKGGVDGFDFLFMAVGTPSKRDGSINLVNVISACKAIGTTLGNQSGFPIVCIRSTVVPGSTAGVIKTVLERYSGRLVGESFGLVAYPEFLREGSAVNDTLSPKRIVFGTVDERSSRYLEAFLKSFYGDNLPPIVKLNPTSAEMVKYAANAFLGVKISFINEIANLCEKYPGVDVTDVANAIGLDPRIGHSFLNAGVGFGGSCLPKDLRALTFEARKRKVRLALVDAALSVNERQPERIVELAASELGRLQGKHVAVLGLSYKPDTDDIREAPSSKIIEALLRANAKVSAYDPRAMQNIRGVFGHRVRLTKNPRDCLKEANCCLIVTEWDEFTSLKPDDFLELMAEPVVVDGRRIFGPKIFDERVRYRGIGLSSSGKPVR
jgi:UDPglucose 6-dehydrogenase